MTSKSRRESYDALTESLQRELMDMSDEDVLEGTDADTAKADGLKLLKAAKLAAGKRRLAAAKKGVAASGSNTPVSNPIIAIDEVKAYIRKASNDGRYTLAARNLDEMTEADLLRIFSQLKRLESSSDSGGEGES